MSELQNEQLTAIAVISGTGWLAVYAVEASELGRSTRLPLLSWVVWSNGVHVPMVADEKGSVSDARSLPGFLGLVSPSGGFQ